MIVYCCVISIEVMHKQLPNIVRIDEIYHIARKYGCLVISGQL